MKINNTKIVNYVELESLAGKEYILTGVDTETIPNPDSDSYYNHLECGTIRFRLNNTTYVAVEDPRDGYRSCLGSIFTTGKNTKYNFPGVRIRAEMALERDHEDYQNNNILQLIDLETKLPILQVGTGNWDDYYPCFVANWIPENLIHNQHLK